MNEEKRDLAKDLELCGTVMPDIAERVAVLVSTDVPEDMAAKYFAFLDQAREGLPHAIRRAIEAEKERDVLREKLKAAVIIAEVMRDFVEDGYVIADEELANALKVSSRARSSRL